MKSILVLLFLLAATGLHAQTAFEYLRMGDAAVQRNDLKEAIEKYGKALEKEPGNQEALYKRGVCRNNTGDAAGAVEDMTQLIALNPNDATFYKTRGLNYTKLDQNEKAEADARKALTLSPKDTVAYYLLGNVLLRQNKTEEAVATFHRYLKLAPNVPEAKQVLNELKKAGFAPVGDARRKVGPKDGVVTMQIPSDWKSHVEDVGNRLQISVASGALMVDPKEQRATIMSGVIVQVILQRDLKKIFPTYRPGKDSVLSLMRPSALYSAGVDTSATALLNERPASIGAYGGTRIEADVRREGQPWTTRTTVYLLQSSNSSCVIITDVPTGMLEVYEPVLNEIVAGIKLK